MNKKLLISAVVALVLLGGVIFMWQKNRVLPSEEMNAIYERLQDTADQSMGDTNQKTSNFIGISQDAVQGNEQLALSLLPREVLLYKLEKNGFNQDGYLYSVNAYISFDTESGLREAGLAGKDSQKSYAGCWVVNLHNKTAYRIANVKDQKDYNFYQWAGNDVIELVGDSKATVTAYDALSGKVISTKVFNLDVNADVSYWNIYRNEKFGFEVKYPEGITVQEMSDNFSESMTSRYVSFYDPGTEATIYLGLKRESEKNISPRPLRTGISGGEFFSRGTVAFGNGIAREVWLTGCYFPGENHCAVELIWFCDDSGDFEGGQCNNIKLGENEVFMEVSLTEKSDVYKVYELMHGMIRTFHTL